MSQKLKKWVKNKGSIVSAENEMEVRLIKATNHDHRSPKLKHVDYLLQKTEDGLVTNLTITNSISKRFKKKSFILIFKSLLLLHRLSNEGHINFLKTFSKSYENSGLFKLNHFKDLSSPNAFEYNEFIRNYAGYLSEKFNAYLQTGYSVNHNVTSKSQSKYLKAPIKKIIEDIPVFQESLDLLFVCETSVMRNDPLFAEAFRLLSQDITKLYKISHDSSLQIIDHFFSLSKTQANTCYKIYKIYSQHTIKIEKWLDISENKGILPNYEDEETTVEESLQKVLDKMKNYVNQIGGNIKKKKKKKNNYSSSSEESKLSVESATSETSEEDEKKSVSSEDENTSSIPIKTLDLDLDIKLEIRPKNKNITQKTNQIQNQNQTQTQPQIQTQNQEISQNNNDPFGLNNIVNSTSQNQVNLIPKLNQQSQNSNIITNSNTNNNDLNNIFNNNNNFNSNNFTNVFNNNNNKNNNDLDGLFGNFNTNKTNQTNNMTYTTQNNNNNSSSNTNNNLNELENFGEFFVSNQNNSNNNNFQQSNKNFNFSQKQNFQNFSIQNKNNYSNQNWNWQTSNQNNRNTSNNMNNDLFSISTQSTTTVNNQGLINRNQLNNNQSQTNFNSNTNTNSQYYNPNQNQRKNQFQNKQQNTNQNRNNTSNHFQQMKKPIINQRKKQDKFSNLVDFSQF
ncbi:phosphatidylinositol-binding clathrin assembly protein lap [Anaeramoeba flamelloides]|uniref:Phosphatidylinositol-binding clathrin assembly protein lap n=1 Tax=Anaeramoeba flamelloides TaxID=1746091 RepID=A0AAV7YZ83_9EUKA|nr:phosphatidylinositol-binding clathrin assembly protein lap [Anaeramoeba flamelloides]